MMTPHSMPVTTPQPPLPWKFLLTVFLVLAVVTTLVPVVDWARRPPDTQYTGYSFESVGDIFFYLNLMEQAEKGETRFENFLTPEPHDPVLFHPLFLVMGRVEALFDLNPLTVWHGTRIALLPVFLVLLAAFLRKLRQPEALMRLAMLFVVASSGFVVVNHEASTFLSLLYSPLSIASLCLTLGFFLLVIASAAAPSWSWRRTLGMASLALLQAMIHPYILIAWVLIPALFLYVEILLRRRTLRSVLPVGVSLLIAAVVGFGYLVIITREPILQLWTSQAEIPPWHPVYQVSFFGLLLPFAVLPFLGAARRRAILANPAQKLLLVWLVATFLLSNSPYPYAGRLQLILHLPLAVFAAHGLSLALQYLRHVRLPRLIVLIFLPFLFLDTCYHLLSNFSGRYLLQENRYVQSSVLAMAQWVRANTPEDAVFLHAPSYDTLFAQLSYRHIFTSLGGLTINLKQRFFESLIFYAGKYSADEARQLLVNSGVDYVLLTGQERSSGDHEAKRFGNDSYRTEFHFNFSPESYPFLRKVYENGSAILYQVIDVQAVSVHDAAQTATEPQVFVAR